MFNETETEYTFNCDSGIVLKWDGVEYTLFVDGEILFEGSDYKPSPLADHMQEFADLAGFLLIRPGDCEKEYFDDYTPEQLSFVSSSRCEYAQIEFMDF
jgi:hypothetical protein